MERASGEAARTGAARRLALVATALSLALLVPGSAMAADEGTVSAQVTVATPCVTVGPSIDYGTLAFGWPGGGSSSFTNCSAGLEQIYLRGTDAVSTTSAATWQLTGTSTSGPTCTPGPNKYFHQAGIVGSAVTLTNSDQLLGSSAAGATETLLTALEMPCSGSDGAGETMTFSIIVTASF